MLKLNADGGSSHKKVQCDRQLLSVGFLLVGIALSWFPSSGHSVGCQIPCSNLLVLDCVQVRQVSFTLRMPGARTSIFFKSAAGARWVSNGDCAS